MDFETAAIHVGQDPEPTTGAVTVPIFQTSTFAQPRVGEHTGYEYARTGNPTRTALQQCLAALEGTEQAVCFASGLAASDAVLRLLSPGDEVVMANDVYGGTWRQVDKVHRRAGIETTPVDLTDLEAVAAAMTPATRFIWAETPSNPLLKILDLAALAEIAHAHDARLVVDNTFATPYLQRPVELGADLVVHSTTKYLGGHSDVVGGAVCTNDAALADQLHFLQNAVGAVPGPWDAWLVLRGVKTLPVRMRAHCANARAIADALVEHAGVTDVRFPGLTDHPGHAVAAKQMRDFGGMVSFRTGDPASARAVCSRFRVFTLGESLGGVESLVEHPGAMTHASTSDSPIAVPDDLVRLSVGIEEVDDLLADLDHALDAAAA